MLTNKKASSRVELLQNWREKYAKVLGILVQKIVVEESDEEPKDKEDQMVLRKKKLGRPQTRAKDYVRRFEKCCSQEEVEEAIEAAESSGFIGLECPELKALKNRLAKVEKQQKCSVDLIYNTNEFNYSVLCDVFQSIQKNGIIFQEANIVEDLVLLNKEMRKSANKPQKMQELKECVSRAEDLSASLDPSILELVQGKLEQFKDYEERLSDFLEYTTVDSIDLRAAKAFSNEAIQIKYQDVLSEKLNGLLITSVWLKKLTKLCKFYIDLETNNMMEMELKWGDLEDDSKMPIELPHDEMISLCSSFLKERDVNSEMEIVLFNKLENEIASEDQLVDEQAKNVLKGLRVFVLRHQLHFDNESGRTRLANLDDSKVPTPQDLLVMGESDLAFVFTQVTNACNWKRRIQKVKNSLKEAFKKKFSTIEEANRVQKEIEELMSSADEFSGYSDLEDYIRDLEDAMDAVALLKRAPSSSSELAESDTFSKVRMLLIDMKRIGLDGTEKAKFLREHLGRFSECYQLISKFSESKMKGEETIQNNKLDFSTVMNEQFYSFVNAKMRKEDAMETMLNLKRSMAGSNEDKLSLESELDEWKAVIQETSENWKKRSELFYAKYSFEKIMGKCQVEGKTSEMEEEESSNGEIDLEELVRELKGLKEEAVRLCVSDPEALGSLKDFEMALCCVSAVSQKDFFGNSSLKNSFTLLNQYSKSLSRPNISPSLKESLGKLLEVLNEKIKATTDISMEISFLRASLSSSKSNGGPVTINARLQRKTLEEFVELTEKIKETPMILDKDRIFIEELRERIETLKNNFNLLKKSASIPGGASYSEGEMEIEKEKSGESSWRKYSAEDVRITYEGILKIPVKVGDAEKVLSEIWEWLFGLESKARGVLFGKKMSQVASIEEIESEYKKCPFEVPEVESLLKIRDKLKWKIKEYQKTLETVKNSFGNDQKGEEKPQKQPIEHLKTIVDLIEGLETIRTKKNGINITALTLEPRSYQELWFNVLLMATSLLKEIHEESKGKTSSDRVKFQLITTLFENLSGLASFGSYSFSLEFNHAQKYIGEIQEYVWKRINQRISQQLGQPNPREESPANGQTEFIVLGFIDYSDEVNEELRKRKQFETERRGVAFSRPSERHHEEQMRLASQKNKGGFHSNSGKSQMEEERGLEAVRSKKMEFEKRNREEILKVQNSMKIQEKKKDNSISSLIEKIDIPHFASDKKEQNQEQELAGEESQGGIGKKERIWRIKSQVDQDYSRMFSDKLFHVFVRHKHVQINPEEAELFLENVENGIIEAICEGSQRGPVAHQYQRMMEKVLRTLSMTRAFNCVSKMLYERQFDFKELRNYLGMSQEDLKELNSMMFHEQMEAKRQMQSSYSRRTEVKADEQSSEPTQIGQHAQFGGNPGMNQDALGSHAPRSPFKKHWINENDPRRPINSMENALNEKNGQNVRNAQALECSNRPMSPNQKKMDSVSPKGKEETEKLAKLNDSIDSIPELIGDKIQPQRNEEPNQPPFHLKTGLLLQSESPNPFEIENLPLEYFSIFSGRIVFGASIDMRDILLLTVNPRSLIRSFQAFESSAFIRGDIPKAEFIQKMDKIRRRNSEDPGSFAVMDAWLETMNPVTGHCFNSLLNKMSQTQTVGKYVFHSGRCLYLVPKSFVGAYCSGVLNMKYVAKNPKEFLAAILITNNKKAKTTYTPINPLACQISPLKKIFNVQMSHGHSQPNENSENHRILHDSQLKPQNHQSFIGFKRFNGSHKGAQNEDQWKENPLKKFHHSGANSKSNGPILKREPFS